MKFGKRLSAQDCDPDELERLEWLMMRMVRDGLCMTRRTESGERQFRLTDKGRRLLGGTETRRRYAEELEAREGLRVH